MNIQGKINIGLSILSADFAALRSSITPLIEDVDFLHLDIMDGHFVPNLTIGIPVVASLRKCFTLPFDVHLMVTNPLNFIDSFTMAGANAITFHIESYNKDSSSIHQTILKSKEKKLKVYIALNPNSEVKTIENFVDKVDGVVLMSVEPGFGGQQFMPHILKKINYVREMAPTTEIRVDGGINISNAKDAILAGIDTLIVGSYAFSSKDAIKNLRKMLSRGEPF